MSDTQAKLGLTEWTTEQLTELIKSNAMKPGDKLPTEQDLCQQFSVSRTVVREAVARLKAEGVLSSRRGSGIYVDSLREPNLPSPFTFGSPQMLADILDCLELRLSVEVEASGLAAERRTETALIELDKAMLLFDQARAENRIAAEADLAFHSAIAKATGNKQFVYFLEQLGQQVIPRKALGAHFVSDEDRHAYLQRIEQDHQAIYEAILSRDADGARQAMRAHLDGSRTRYRQWSVQQGQTDISG